ncbi:MAG: RluA family pseudouridine synthase [Rubripirellula sp.]
MQEILQHRNETLRQSHQRLPGSQPYDNYRPINVPAKFDGQTLLNCLLGMHPHVGSEQWRDWFDRGHILKMDQPVAMDQIVRGGHQYLHLFPNTIEPDVNASITVVWEDDTLIAVNKPAPLPVHACGRFNRNTMLSLLHCIYTPEDLRLVHRLDANTTGLMLLARSREAATNLRLQFERNQICKRYIVRCQGTPAQEQFTCRAPISRERGLAGLRTVNNDGLTAETEFRLLETADDGTSLLEARPLTGRTNQIRIHLWSLGTPVCGDPAYLSGGKLAAMQTLTPDQPPMCLHAAQLAFQHPKSDRPMVLTVEPPRWPKG